MTCLDVSHCDVASSPYLITVLPVELGSVGLKCCRVGFDIMVGMEWVELEEKTERRRKLQMI